MDSSQGVGREEKAWDGDIGGECVAGLLRKRESSTRIAEWGDLVARNAFQHAAANHSILQIEYDRLSRHQCPGRILGQGDFQQTFLCRCQPTSAAGIATDSPYDDLQPIG